MLIHCVARPLQIEPTSLGFDLGLGLFNSSDYGQTQTGQVRSWTLPIRSGVIDLLPGAQTHKSQFEQMSLSVYNRPEERGREPMKNMFARFRGRFVHGLRRDERRRFCRRERGGEER